jgi:hypothetical protein
MSDYQALGYGYSELPEYFVHGATACRVENGQLL